MGIGGTSVYLPWKSVESGGYDKLIARIEGIPADSVFFSRESASMVMTAPGSSKGEKQLLITGQGHREEDQLFAWYKTTTGDSIKKYNQLAGRGSECGEL
ncbi:MAG: hypothetical protein HC905_17435 [Bacteroidales bacterium]|nr:hypothetical protein [Bacteroidales bacterium]